MKLNRAQIRHIQGFLIIVGLAGPNFIADGVIGVETTAAVIALQAHYELEATGNLDEATCRIINGRLAQWGETTIDRMRELADQHRREPKAG